MSSTNWRAERQIIPILYNIPHCQTPRDNNGESNQCASAASCGAARSAVARREVGSSNYGDRVVKRYGNISHGNPTDPNRIGSFAAENGAGAKSEMGEGSEWIAVREGSDGFGSCQTHDVSISPQEDRGGAAGTLGAGEGGEEGGVGRTLYGEGSGGNAGSSSQ
jgi:hypothetical protein